MMLTLTIDPELFPDLGDGVCGSERAFRYVREKRCVARLVKALHQRGHLRSHEFFAVIEWHQDGRPHYHVLVEAEYIPHDVLTDLWGRFRPPTAPPRAADRPGFGWVKFTHRKLESMEHAANYASKYLVKHPEHVHYVNEKGEAVHYPRWVMQFRGEIRRFYTSRGFWGSSRTSPAGQREAAQAHEAALVRDDLNREEGELAELQAERAAAVELQPRKSIADRIACCCEKAVLLQVHGHGEWGKGGWQVVDVQKISRRHDDIRRQFGLAEEFAWKGFFVQYWETLAVFSASGMEEAERYRRMSPAQVARQSELQSTASV